MEKSGADGGSECERVNCGCQADYVNSGVREKM
jgi:hypothetical protein